LENHGQIKDKIVEIKASVPGTTLMSKSVDKTFEASADEAQNSLINQIKKYKEKLRLNR
jgi:putative sigma-54 modulation protein